MSRDTYYKQKYYCKTCKKHEYLYIWLSDIEKPIPHSECNTVLKPVFVEEVEVPGLIIKSTHQKGRSKAEKEKRRTDHFVKEILPTIGGRDKRYFEEKFNVKKKKK